MDDSLDAKMGRMMFDEKRECFGLWDYCGNSDRPFLAWKYISCDQSAQCHKEFLKNKGVKMPKSRGRTGRFKPDEPQQVTHTTTYTVPNKTCVLCDENEGKCYNIGMDSEQMGIIEAHVVRVCDRCLIRINQIKRVRSEGAIKASRSGKARVERENSLPRRVIR